MPRVWSVVGVVGLVVGPRLLALALARPRRRVLFRALFSFLPAASARSPFRPLSRGFFSSTLLGALPYYPVVADDDGDDTPRRMARTQYR